MENPYKNCGMIVNGEANFDDFITGKYGEYRTVKLPLIVKFYDKIKDIDFDSYESFETYCEDFLKEQTIQVNSQSLYDIWIQFKNNKELTFERTLRDLELKFTTFLYSISISLFS